MNEVDLLVGIPGFGRHTQVEVADPGFQLLSEGQVLRHGPLLHELLHQGDPGQAFDGCGLVRAHRGLLIDPVAERVMGAWDCQIGKGDVVEVRGERGHPVGIADFR